MFRTTPFLLSLVLISTPALSQSASEAKTKELHCSISSVAVGSHEIEKEVRFKINFPGNDSFEFQPSASVMFGGYEVAVFASFRPAHSGVGSGDEDSVTLGSYLIRRTGASRQVLAYGVTTSEEAQSVTPKQRLTHQQLLNPEMQTFDIAHPGMGYAEGVRRKLLRPGIVHSAYVGCDFSVK